MSIRKHIPNTITCCNLISGCIATCFAFFHEPKLALIWIIIGAVFDFFDGMSARLLHVSSPIGKELDSLADDITFGVAPSTIIFSQLLVMEYPDFMQPVADYVPFLAFVMAAFSALRLAKFNLDERQSLGFVGLPTPANALFWGSLIVGAHSYFETSSWMTLVLILGVFVSCFLLVSEIPMFALKFKHWGWKGNEVKYIFLLTCVPLLFIFRISAFAVIIAWYVVLSVGVDLYSRNAATAQRD
ncbi:MAG: CDP-alcohol phosphatidyltransferase family protein [Prevotella sp.]|nr:CDP-alcohol phosphatidyltransferase family protein [Prevotella sp.]